MAKAKTPETNWNAIAEAAYLAYFGCKNGDAIAAPFGEQMESSQNAWIAAVKKAAEGLSGKVAIVAAPTQPAEPEVEPADVW
jgi:hypothetical protein